MTEQGPEATEVVRDLGICTDTLRSWYKVAGRQLGASHPQQPANQRIRKLEAEIRTWRKQLCEKERVIDIVKT